MTEPVAGHVGASRTRPRRRVRLLVAGVVVAIALPLAAWQLLPLAGIGYPDERYSTTPEPCRLLGAGTVRELAGSSTGERTVLTGSSGWRPAAYRETTLRCEWDDPGGAAVTVTVERFVGAQFGLGRSGAEKAQGESGDDACNRDLAGGRDDACVWGGLLLDDVLLFVRRENVVVTIDVDDVEVAPEEADELVATLAGDVLSRLDEV